MSTSTPYTLSNAANLNDRMDEESPEEKSANSNFMDEKLFNSRSISIFGSINERVARTVTQQLLALAAENNDPITIYISSPGGHVESGDVVYDMIKFIQPEVRVVGTGWVASAGALIYSHQRKNAASPFLTHASCSTNQVAEWVVPPLM